MSDSARQQAEDHYYTGLDHYAEGRHDEAIAEYEKALEADPSLSDALHALARAYQDLNRIDDAIRVAQKIAESAPDDVLAHTSLSILYQRKGMIPEAEAEAEAEANKARILGWKQQLKDSRKS